MTNFKVSEVKSRRNPPANCENECLEANDGFFSVTASTAQLLSSQGPAQPRWKSGKGNPICIHNNCTCLKQNLKSRTSSICWPECFGWLSPPPNPVSRHTEFGATDAQRCRLSPSLSWRPILTILILASLSRAIFRRAFNAISSSKIAATT